MDRKTRQKNRVLKHLECPKHQPFKKLTKSNYLFGYKCECGFFIPEHRHKMFMDNINQINWINK